MRITFVTRKFGNVERNSHCDVLHITPIRVARLVLDCNGVFATKAYTPLVQSSLHDLFGSLRHSCPSYMCSFRILSLHVKVYIIISLLISTVLNINVTYNMRVECFLPFSPDSLLLQILFSPTAKSVCFHYYFVLFLSLKVSHFLTFRRHLPVQCSESLRDLSIPP